MKILLVHNFYRQPGGEDAVFEVERDLLRDAGHEVCEYVRRNEEIGDDGIWSKLSAGLRATWAWDSAAELRRILQYEKPALAHFHNTFPLISPAAYYECRAAGLPVVQTLHNYRLVCPAATLSREDHLCEECIQHSLWRAVRHGCYRDSRAASAAAAVMLAAHRSLRTWTRLVDCYVVPSLFARDKFIEAGLPTEKIFVKPNFVSPDPGIRSGQGEYALFVGRVLPEKGLNTLLKAWNLLRDGIPLRIIGDGPLLADLKCGALRDCLSGVSFEGARTRAETIAAMKSARLLIFPSEWYETFGRVIAEAFACGVPVVASRLGAMRELVEDGRTGLHFTPGDAADLAAKIA